MADDRETEALEGADRDGLAAVAILVVTVVFIVVVLIALLS